MHLGASVPAHVVRIALFACTGIAVSEDARCCAYALLLVLPLPHHAFVYSMQVINMTKAVDRSFAMLKLRTFHKVSLLAAQP